jgi:hypothetical protein
MSSSVRRWLPEFIWLDLAIRGSEMDLIGQILQTIRHTTRHSTLHTHEVIQIRGLSRIITKTATATGVSEVIKSKHNNTYGQERILALQHVSTLEHMIVNVKSADYPGADLCSTRLAGASRPSRETTSNIHPFAEVIALFSRFGRSQSVETIASEGRGAGKRALEW